IAVAQKYPQANTLDTAKSLEIKDGKIFNWQNWSFKLDPNWQLSGQDTVELQNKVQIDVKNREWQFKIQHPEIVIKDNQEIWLANRKIFSFEADKYQIWDGRFDFQLKTLAEGEWYADLVYNNKSLVHFIPKFSDLSPQAQGNFSEKAQNFTWWVIPQSSSSGDNALGWEGEDLSLLALSGGQAGGEAFQNYQGILDVWWGDPVLSLAHRESDELASGYQPSLGKLIYQSDSPLQNIQAMDYNGDEKKDLVLKKNDNTLLLLENQISQFIKREDYAETSAAILDLQVGDFANDQHDDLLLPLSNSKLAYLKNEKGQIAPAQNLLKQFSTGKEAKFLEQVQAADFDQDGVVDILAKNSRGELLIYYGSSAGFGDPVLIYAGGFQVNPDFDYKDDLSWQDFLEESEEEAEFLPIANDHKKQTSAATMP
ncbi:MAG TPA: hypothetical protein PLQ36_03975, partial [Candidatus Gracilibacteria bacterium]|nr:hypothetical protein [Candidatus Gracilibacteria bacterium]